MANLSDDEQAELQNMTAEERQAFAEERFGAGNGAGKGGPARGGQLAGEVVEVAADTITVKLESGSQTFYVDDETLVASVEGTGPLAVGSQVMVIAEPTSDGVTTASVVVVK